MKTETYNLTIVKVQNGYTVYLNDEITESAFGKIRPVPYVFETMETLQDFINKKLSF
jgi:hypothetical protein